jgi:hypothetical protein
MLKTKKIISAAAALIALGLMSGQAYSAQTCKKFYTHTSTPNSEYYVQSNFWNSNVKDDDMCIDYDYESTEKNFTFRNIKNKVSADGLPLGYPSVYKGCHYGQCTSNSGMPVKVSKLKSVTGSWSVYTNNVSGKWVAAYDLFFDKSEYPGNRYPNGAEIMIWINKRDASSSDKVYPAGQQGSDAKINNVSYEVWKGTVNGTPVISYVAKTKVNSVSNLDVKAFIDHAVKEKVVEKKFYLQSIQAGFEPHRDGTGLRSDYFTATVK